jgi:hypothetical protein
LLLLLANQIKTALEMQFATHITVAYAQNLILEMTVVIHARNLIAALIQDVKWYMEQLNVSVTKDSQALMAEAV